MSPAPDSVQPRSKTVWALVLAGLVVLALGYWLWSKPGQAELAGAAEPSAQDSDAMNLGDPSGDRAGFGPGQGLGPAAIMGTVTDLAGAPLDHARVCARSTVLREGGLDTPTCTDTGADGHYRLELQRSGALNLYASAAEHQPSHVTVELSAGTEQRVDLELQSGAVLIRGVVHDLAGGEVEGAVLAISGDSLLGDSDTPALAFSDEQGQFSAWVRRGRVRVRATAQGYAFRTLYSAAPGPTVEVYLVPEAVIVGRVVDAGSGAPIAGVGVYPGIGGGGEFLSFTPTDEAITRSDANGYFRVAGLEPGAFRPYVANGHWRGRAAQTIKLGLGETSATVEIPVVRGATVRARVVSKGTENPACLGGSATVSPAPFELYTAAIDDAGWVEIGGLAPGDYEVNVSCHGRYLSDLTRFSLSPDGGDLDELRWSIEPGFDVRGTIVDGRGQPLPGIVVLAELLPDDDDERGATARRARAEPSDKTGAFALVGLEPGSYELRLGGSSGPSLAAPFELELGSQDREGVRLEAQSPGELAGRVIDDRGAPVLDITVTAYASKGLWVDTRSDDEGRFEFVGLGPDQYRVVAYDGRWSLELGATEAEVEVDARSEVELVVERGNGTIRGRVLDDGQTPLDDAFISIERQDEALVEPAERGKLKYSEAKGRPVLTDVDGSFELTGLPKGLYTVRAKQRQGGEAVASNLRPGAKVELVIESLARMAGTLAIPGEHDLVSFAITAKLDDGSFETRDQWTVSGKDPDKRWILDGLPPGPYTLTVESNAGDGNLKVELAPGAALDNLRLELEGRVSLRGRLVDGGDQSPIANARVRVGSPTGAMSGPGIIPWVRSDADGAFVLEVPVGELVLQVVPPGSADGRRHQSLRKTIQVDAEPKRQDLGDLPLAPS